MHDISKCFKTLQVTSILCCIVLIDTSTLKLIVRAEVKKGYAPVIGAKVEVQVGTLPWRLMKDDGVGKAVFSQQYFHLAYGRYCCNSNK